jgi:hypothetical protein
MTRMTRTAATAVAVVGLGILGHGLVIATVAGGPTVTATASEGGMVSGDVSGAQTAVGVARIWGHLYASIASLLKGMAGVIKVSTAAMPTEIMKLGCREVDVTEISMVGLMTGIAAGVAVGPLGRGQKNCLVVP